MQSVCASINRTHDSFSHLSRDNKHGNISYNSVFIDKVKYGSKF